MILINQYVSNMPIMYAYNESETGGGEGECKNESTRWPAQN